MSDLLMGTYKLKKQLGAIQISSDTSPKKLSEMLEIMIEYVESDLCIIVEECEGDNSYWSPTPITLIEDLDHFGTIELGDQQSEFEKIISLAHEVGHCALESNINFGDFEEIIFKEAVAWFLGYEYFLSRGWEIDLEHYRESASIALNNYIRSLNERNVK